MDGSACTSGVDCCGGFCAGGKCSPPMGCAGTDDKCTKSSDCCDPSQQCIGGFCATVTK
jgi:hypothetical protein